MCSLKTNWIVPLAKGNRFDASRIMTPGTTSRSVFNQPSSLCQPPPIWSLGSEASSR